MAFEGTNPIPQTILILSITPVQYYTHLMVEDNITSFNALITLQRQSTGYTAIFQKIVDKPAISYLPTWILYIYNRCLNYTLERISKLSYYRCYWGGGRQKPRNNFYTVLTGTYLLLISIRLVFIRTNIVNKPIIIGVKNRSQNKNVSISKFL